MLRGFLSLIGYGQTNAPAPATTPPEQEKNMSSSGTSQPLIQQRMQQLLGRSPAAEADDFVHLAYVTPSLRARAKMISQLNFYPAQKLISVTPQQHDQKQPFREIAAAIKDKVTALSSSISPPPVTVPAAEPEQKKEDTHNAAAATNPTQKKFVSEQPSPDWHQELKAALENRRKKIATSQTKPRQESSQATQTVAQQAASQTNVNHTLSIQVHRYQRLNSADLTNADSMDDSLFADIDDAVQEHDKADEPYSIDDLREYFESIGPEFSQWKEKYQNIALTKPPEQSTLLFPRLIQYQSGSPALDFREMRNLTYLKQVATHIMLNFNKYMAYTLPRLKSHCEMIEKNLIDSRRIEKANATGLEFAEQMRRTSHSAANLLEQAESYNERATIANTIETLLSGMVDKLNAASQTLDRLHTAINKYRADQLYGNSTALERTPLLRAHQ